MRFIIIFTFLLLSFHSQAQTNPKCGTPDYIKQQILLDPSAEDLFLKAEQEAAKFEANHPEDVQVAPLVTIPVVVHIVYKNDIQNLDSTRVYSQISVLNTDFSKLNADTTLIPSAWKSRAANVNIQFCLATIDPEGNPTNGITRTLTTSNTFNTDNKVKSNATGGKDGWDRSRYLNIWVCNLETGLLGYATPPGGAASVDGVVVKYSCFGKPGTQSGFNLGRTCIHEVGHWLGLKHIWGDDNGSCSGSDDVSDTPNQSDNTWGCPTFPVTDTCSNTTPGIMFMNYMDYSDDACLVMFTNGQKSKMQSAINTTRVSLKNSWGCSALGIRSDGNQVSKLQAFPNPSGGNCSVIIPGKGVLVIRNLLGVQLYEESFDSGGTIQPDFSFNEQGIYLLEFKGPGLTQFSKILISK